MQGSQHPFQIKKDCYTITHKGGLLLEAQTGFGAFLIVMQHRYNLLPPLRTLTKIT
jgi:hypothetical protein